MCVCVGDAEDNDLFGIQRQLWAEQELFEQGSIANWQRKGQRLEITQDTRLPLLTDGPVIPAMNAR